MEPIKFEEGQRVRFKKEVRFADIVVAEGELGTVDANQDYTLPMLRIKLDKEHTSEVLGPTSLFMAERAHEIESDTTPLPPPNPHAICGNCEKRYDEHVYHDAEFHCPHETIASVWTSQPALFNIACLLADTRPALYAELVAEWKQKNGH